MIYWRFHSNKYLEVGRFRVDRRRSTKSRISSIYSGATGFCCKRIRESVHFCRWKSLPRIEFILLCILSIILESHSPLLRVVLTLKARCRLFSLYIYHARWSIYTYVHYTYTHETHDQLEITFIVHYDHYYPRHCCRWLFLMKFHWNLVGDVFYYSI